MSFCFLPSLHGYGFSGIMQGHLTRQVMSSPGYPQYVTVMTVPSQKECRPYCSPEAPAASGPIREWSEIPSLWLACYLCAQKAALLVVNASHSSGGPGQGTPMAPQTARGWWHVFPGQKERYANETPLCFLSPGCHSSAAVLAAVQHSTLPPSLLFEVPQKKLQWTRHETVSIRNGIYIQTPELLRGSVIPQLLQECIYPSECPLDVATLSPCNRL